MNSIRFTAIENAIKVESMVSTLFGETFAALPFNNMTSTAITLSATDYSLKDFNCTDYAVSVFNTGMTATNQTTVQDWVVHDTFYGQGGPVTTVTNYGSTSSGLHRTLSNKSGVSTSSGNSPIS